MSGADCARALRRAGLVVLLDGPDRLLVKRQGVPLVSIPLVDRLRGELVAAIAKTAGLTAAEFLSNVTP
ncbi:MAG TPA: hypothetical protein VF765_05210 [Polyangiaceae bacterium]